MAELIFLQVKQSDLLILPLIGWQAMQKQFQQQISILKTIMVHLQVLESTHHTNAIEEYQN